jgi:hypothetical protein
MANKSLAAAWKPGQSGNPKGRAVGSRNKLGENFINVLYEHFLEHGPKAIERVYNSRPDIYLKVIASTLPREMHFKNASAYDGLTDDKLDEVIDRVRAVLLASTPTESRTGEATPVGKNELN